MFCPYQNKHPACESAFPLAGLLLRLPTMDHRRPFPALVLHSMAADPAVLFTAGGAARLWSWDSLAHLLPTLLKPTA